jgi:hypothetical protein
MLPHVEAALRERLKQILEPSQPPTFNRWCGCYEGDMDDSFPEMRDYAVNEIVKLFDEYEMRLIRNDPTIGTIGLEPTDEMLRKAAEQ